MYHNVNTGVDLTVNPPRFPTQLHPDLLNMAKEILEYLRTLTPEFINIGTRDQLRLQLKELNTLRVGIASSFKSDKSLEWLSTAHALMDEIEKTEKILHSYFEQNPIKEEDDRADLLVLELKSLTDEQNKFHQSLSNKPKNAADRAKVQKQYESVKQKISDFGNKLISQESGINPVRHYEMCINLNKLCNSFMTDRHEWREQQFNRLTRMQDKAQLFFSDIGSGISGKWSQLLDFVSGKDEKSLAKRLSHLERQVSFNKEVIDTIVPLLEQTPAYRAQMQEVIRQLDDQLSDLDTAFDTLHERRPLSPQTRGNDYLGRILKTQSILEGMNRVVACTDLAAATTAITTATSRSDAVLAIERANTILLSLTAETPLIRRSAVPGDLQRVMQAQTRFEIASAEAMQKFGISAVSPRATSAQVNPSRPDSMR